MTSSEAATAGCVWSSAEKYHSTDVSHKSAVVILSPLLLSWATDVTSPAIIKQSSRWPQQDPAVLAHGWAVR